MKARKTEMAKRPEGLASIFEREDSLLTEIGRAVSIWGAVNHIVRSALVDIKGCSHDDADQLLGAKIGEGARLKFLRDALEEREDEFATKVRACLDELIQLSRDRNLIVHSGGIWGSRDNSPVTFHIVDFRTPEGPERYKLAAPFVENHIAQMRKAGGELFDLVYAEQIAVMDGRGFQLSPPSPSFAEKDS